MVCKDCNGLGYTMEPDPERTRTFDCDACQTTGGFCDDCGEASSTNLCGSCDEQRMLDEEANRRALNREYEASAMPNFGTLSGLPFGRSWL